MSNHTQNGECSKCGTCCTSLLPFSKEEIIRIKKYIADNNIKPVNRNTVLNPVYQDICPFLQEDKLCAIYPVRAEICQKFQCDKRITQFNHFDKTIINLFTEFFPEEYLSNPPDVKSINMEYQNRKDRIFV